MRIPALGGLLFGVAWEFLRNSYFKAGPRNRSRADIGGLCYYNSWWRCAMANCANMKVGDVYKCDFCGLEIEVKQECTCNDEDCRCNELECCGSAMSKA